MSGQLAQAGAPELSPVKPAAAPPAPAQQGLGSSFPINATCRPPPAPSLALPRWLLGLLAPLGVWGRRGGGQTHLARGGHGEAEAVGGDVDGDAHAGEAKVALAQDGRQGLVGGLSWGRSTARAAMGGGRRGAPRMAAASPRLPTAPPAPRETTSLTHLFLPGSPDARHGLVEPVDGFPGDGRRGLRECGGGGQGESWGGRSQRGRGSGEGAGAQRRAESERGEEGREAGDGRGWGLGNLGDECPAGQVQPTPSASLQPADARPPAPAPLPPSLSQGPACPWPRPNRKVRGQIWGLDQRAGGPEPDPSPVS